ncbi:endonuclease domain-containing protein [Allisonella histaminiformans]|uniref:endonuclease domain-containing protein n=1 Tax=Allisonella histaminiformans TaxID=209880 RepID=UPI0026EC14C6|nr:endonuclease domain-containing protein [Allisonella histaminiformans]
MYKCIYRTIRSKKHARRFRKAMTREEKILWGYYLRKYPVRFHRQYAIGRYIADFYCRKAKLVIELDGSQHFMKDRAAHDCQRTAFMKQFGILVLRFMNKEILTNLSGVCEYIDYVVKQRLKELRNSQSQELYL